ncbi:MAG: HD-GYP domain-containing protein [Acidobacteriota bacterium]
MRFATRIFLWSFLPLGILLAVTFWVVRNTVVSTVREGLLASVRQNQQLLVSEHQRNERQSSRLLEVLSENPSLKAGLQLLRDEHGLSQAVTQGENNQARATVEDQLSELSGTLGFEFVVVSDVAGKALAGIVATASGFEPANLSKFGTPRSGFFQLGSNFYQVYKIPIHQGDESVGTLMVGEPFDIAKLPTPAVLLHRGIPAASNAAGFPLADSEKVFARCQTSEECEFRLHGASYLSLPLRESQRVDAGADTRTDREDEFQLRSLQDLDSASAPVQATLRGVFLTAEASILVAALGISLLSSRSIVRPLGSVVQHLREAGKTGRLPEFSTETQKVQEIHALMDGFNQASSAVRRSREELLAAYVEFVGSLAQAVDARDPYTAGHSRRVSRYSCAIAEQMQIPARELETIRIGGLLHDVGKIGISDVVLQKPGRLTPEEDALIRQHPTIGRRILEGVHGFEAYLPIVELHHENWDGSGYPHGLTAPQTPLDARIVKVADAYDAMTSDRPYRKGMAHEKALAILSERVDIEFDRQIVETLARLPISRILAAAENGTALDAAAEQNLSLENLLETLHRSSGDSPFHEGSALAAHENKTGEAVAASREGDA